MDDACELRKLAEWYRAFAGIGRSKERAERLKWAEYLDELADQMERRAARAR